MKRKLTLGLFGFGCVGQGLHRVLSEAKGLDAEIRKICIHDPTKPRCLPVDLFTTNKEELLLDPEIDVIVELIHDPAVAFSIAREAVLRGKDVVTANKRMIAEHLDEIVTLQQTTGQSILYEGAVCGSIPIIRNLEEYYDNDSLNRVEGIFNGSTNYILTRIAEEGLSYADALRDALALGFAEADPRLDVEGFDPACKLSILLTHAFGLRVKPADIVRIGINQLSGNDLSYARKNGLMIKLVAGAYRNGDRVTALVAPKLVKESNQLHAIRNEFNAVVLEGLFAEEQLFVGKGAGGNPTGAAVLSDIAALRYGYRYEYRKLSQKSPVEFSNDVQVEVTVSFNGTVAVSPKDFIDFKGGVRSGTSHRLHGVVHMDQLAQWAETDGISVILHPDAFTTPQESVIGEELAVA